MWFYKRHTKLLEEIKRKSNSRRSVHKRGASESIDKLWAKIKKSERKEKTKALRKAKKKLSRTVNKARGQLTHDGIQGSAVEGRTDY